MTLKRSEFGWLKSAGIFLSAFIGVHRRPIRKTGSEQEFVECLIGGQLGIRECSGGRHTGGLYPGLYPLRPPGFIAILLPCEGGRAPACSADGNRTPIANRRPLLTHRPRMRS